MTFMNALNLRPTSRAREIRLPNTLLDLLPHPDSLEPVEERAGRPLPLQQVLLNIDTLHSGCNGTHACGLPPHLQTYDLLNYLKVLRASKQEAN